MPPNVNIIDKNLSRIGCTIYVPAEAVNTYKMADGWKEFWNILPIEGDVPEMKQCATPSIAYASGELSFTCDTEGAVYHYNIATSSNMDKEGFTEGTAAFVPTLTVTAYATADGYMQSEIATATFDLDGGYKEVVKEVIKEVEKEVIVYVYDSNEPTDIALETGETMKLYLSTGKAMIVDAPMGSVVSVYSNTGAMVKTLTVNDVATTIELPSDNIYIIKVGSTVFKVKV